MSAQSKAAIIAHQLDSIKTEGRGLTKWEEDFIDSVTDQFDHRGSVSDRQAEIIERIYKERVV